MTDRALEVAPRMGLAISKVCFWFILVTIESFTEFLLQSFSRGYSILVIVHHTILRIWRKGHLWYEDVYIESYLLRDIIAARLLLNRACDRSQTSTPRKHSSASLSVTPILTTCTVFERLVAVRSEPRVWLKSSDKQWPDGSREVLGNSPGMFWGRREKRGSIQRTVCLWRSSEKVASSKSLWKRSYHLQGRIRLLDPYLFLTPNSSYLNHLSRCQSRLSQIISEGNVVLVDLRGWLESTIWLLNYTTTTIFWELKHDGEKLYDLLIDLRRILYASHGSNSTRDETIERLMDQVIQSGESNIGSATYLHHDLFKIFYPRYLFAQLWPWAFDHISALGLGWTRKFTDNTHSRAASCL